MSSKYLSQSCDYGIVFVSGYFLFVNFLTLTNYNHLQHYVALAHVTHFIILNFYPRSVTRLPIQNDRSRLIVTDIPIKQYKYFLCEIISPCVMILNS